MYFHQLRLIFLIPFHSSLSDTPITFSSRSRLAHYRGKIESIGHLDMDQIVAVNQRLAALVAIAVSISPSSPRCAINNIDSIRKGPRLFCQGPVQCLFSPP